jgi:probable addiction module antidote protein
MEMRQFRKFKDILREDLKDPIEAQAYLEVALEEYEKDKDTFLFLACLKEVAEAQGGLTKLAEKTHLNRQNLYRALSKKGNPKFETLEVILHSLGFRLSVKRIDRAEL